MSTSPFRRARSAESKQQRADSLVRAARELAAERGVRSVTLSAVAERAGVHHSAMCRYFDSHKDVLLRLAAEGWDRWADAVVDAAHDRAVSPPSSPGSWPAPWPPIRCCATSWRTCRCTSNRTSRSGG